MDCRNIFYTFAVVKNKTLSTFLVFGPGKHKTEYKKYDDGDAAIKLRSIAIDPQGGGRGLHSKKKPRNAAAFFKIDTLI